MLYHRAKEAIMSEIDANKLMLEMKALATQAKGLDTFFVESKDDKNEFGTLLKDAIAKVNQYQQEAENLATRFEAGEEGISLSSVMVALQKSNISLQAMAQVRNRIVSAYQEIMNMPV